MAYNWNPWHGCIKYSEGCKYCYVYRHDEKYNIDARNIYQTQNIDLPIRKKKNGTYKIPPNSLIWTCFTSDFFLEEADEYRIKAWDIIRERKDCHFLFLTKRIKRFYKNLPIDWGDGWNNVTICVTCENQTRADERLSFFNTLPIKHKQIVLQPLLENIDISKYLNDSIEGVEVGGESGLESRPCNYDWILNIRNQCINKNISFHFRQTGALFIKDNISYHILKRFQASQARKANINYKKNKSSN